MALMVISTTLLLLGIFGKASGCGDRYTTESGTITHPAVSGDYYNSNELCAWIIISPIPLYFYFSKFTTETSYDIVYARDGSSVGAPLINTFSGKSVNSTFITTGDAYVQFRSDSNVVGTGFVLYWKPYSAEEQCKEVGGFCVKSGDKCDGTISIIHNSCDDRCVCCVPQVSKPRILAPEPRRKVCGGVFSHTRGMIIHPMDGGNYQDNEDCVWVINAGTPIQITFTSFQTEFNWDLLQIRDGDNSCSSELGILSGHTLPGPGETSGNAAYLQFTSDDSKSFSGFELHWKPSDCPNGFKDIGGRCFKFIEELAENNRTQPQARLYCQVLSHESYDVDLATMGRVINSESEPLMEYIIDNGLGNGGLWLGAEKSRSGYTWVDGRPLSSNSYLWDPHPQSLGPPNTIPTHNPDECVLMLPMFYGPATKRSYLAAAQCTSLMNFACEKFPKKF